MIEPGKNKNIIQWSWILYDVANSAFILVMVTAVMPIFFKEYAAIGLDKTAATANWGFANSIAALVLAVSAPVLGTIADYKNFKKPFFLNFFLLGVAVTFLLATVQQGAWLYCLSLFILGRIGFAGANLFYDAFLPDVASRREMDRLSAQGFAWGYIGSVIPFVTVIALLFTGGQNDGAFPADLAKIGFAIVGCWWFLLTIPFLKNVRQRYHVPLPANPFSTSIQRLLSTFADIRNHQQTFLFLLAYFFYIDGVDTIITMAGAYGIDIGLPAPTLIMAILMIQIVAFPFTLFYGKMAERFSTKNVLLSGICVYVLVTIIAFYLPSLPSLFAKKSVFWVLSFLVATSMGGIQALSRSFFGQLIPPENSAEFFGFYNIFGKFAAIAGPFLMGILGRISGDSRFGVLAIVLLLLTGGILLTRVTAASNA